MRVRNKHSGLMATVDMTYYPAEYLGKHRVVYDDGSAWYMTDKQLNDTFETAYVEAKPVLSYGNVVLNNDGTVHNGFTPELLEEHDPSGRSLKEKGTKADAGKNRMGLVIGGFAKALQSVGEVGTFGANKYTDNGWKSVPNAKERYTDAMLRHYFKEQAGELRDPETNIYHAAHLAWNALARLEKLIEEDSIEQSNSNTLEQRRVSDNEENLRANPFYTGGWHSAIY